MVAFVRFFDYVWRCCCRPGASHLLVVGLLLAPGQAAAELILPPGFTARVYVTGEGFDTSRNTRGIPATSTLALDEAGTLYLARTGRRYFGGDAEDLWPIYRIPVGGAQVTPETEARYLYGPPVPNAQVGAIRAGREIFLTTFDRERKIGVVYRLLDGRAEFFAGGTPPQGAPPILKQPEGAAFDVAGNLYVADREAGVIVKFDASGRVFDPRYVSVTRPRVLAIDANARLWIGSDGSAEAPWQRGPGEIWKVGADGGSAVVLRGLIPAGISVGPGGHLFVADRHEGKIFFIGPEGKAAEFASFTDGDAPRSLAFAPVTPETRKAGIAGDLFVIIISRGAWPINEVIRISGPFDELVRKHASGAQ